MPPSLLSRGLTNIEVNRGRVDFIRGLPGTGPPGRTTGAAAKSRRSRRDRGAKRARHITSSRSRRTALSISGAPSRGTRGGNGERKSAQGEGRGSARWLALWDVAAALSPCQECNSHAVGIPSRSIPFAARLLLRGPDAFLRADGRR